MLISVDHFKKMYMFTIYRLTTSYTTCRMEKTKLNASETDETQGRSSKLLLQGVRVQRFKEFLHLRNRGDTSEWAWMKLVESEAVFQQPILPFSHHELGAVTHTSTRRIKGVNNIARDADSIRNLLTQVRQSIKLQISARAKRFASATEDTSETGHGLSIGADFSFLAPENEREVLVGGDILMAPVLLQFSYRGPDSPTLHRHATHCAVKIRFTNCSSKMRSIDLCFDSKCMISKLLSLKLLPFPMLPQYMMCISARDPALAQPLIAVCGTGASQDESGRCDSRAE